jgi:hypothetical protein
MAATLATFNDVLLEDFEPNIIPQLNEETEVYNAFMRGTASWHGRNWNMSMKVGRNAGVGYTDGTLPAAGNQTYARFQGTAKRLYGTVHLDGLLLDAAKQGGSNVIVDWAEGEMEGLLDDIKVSADRDLVSGGLTMGFISRHQNWAGAQAWEFDGDTDKAQAYLDAAGGVTVNVIIRRMDTLAITGTVAMTLVTATAALRTITLTNLDTATGIPVGTVHAVEMADAAVIAAMGIANEPIGIYTNLGLNVHHGVDRTTLTGTPILQTNQITQQVATGTGRQPLTRARMKRMLSLIYQASGQRPTQIWTSASGIEQYENISVAVANTNVQVLAGDKATKADIGVAAKSSDETGLAFEGIPIKRKRFVDPGMMLFMGMQNRWWSLQELSKGRFEDRGGGVLQPVAGDDSFEGYWKAYHELICRRPNVSGILCGLNFA